MSRSKRRKIKKSSPDIKSKTIASKANGITVGLTAPATYRTYTDPTTGTAPDYLTVSLPVSISQAGLTGTSIELPYGFYPSKRDPVFKDFDNTTPIFSLVTPSTPSANSIVASYVNDTANKKLIIRLKQTKTTLETINLRFKFNSVYDAKIPSGQIVWNNLQAKVFDTTGTQIASSVANKTVKTDVGSLAAYISSSYADPSDNNYFDGDIVLAHSYRFYHLAKANLDPGYNHQVYVEIPTGATLKGTLANKLLKTGITNLQDSSVPVGFTRYYQKLVTLSPVVLENPATLVDLAYLDTRVTLNKTYAEGSSFSINFGMKVKFQNGKIDTLTTTKSYIKRSRPDFQLSGGGYHLHVVGSTTSVNNLDSLATAGNFYAFGINPFSSPYTIKNTGTKAIQGMTYKVQELTAGSAKGNFANLYIYVLTDGMNAPAYYHSWFQIKNAVTGTSRSVWSSTPAKNSSFRPALPTLATNEYIATINIIPMGTDGKTTNSLPPGNGIALRYDIKSWPNGKWPDRTTLSKKSNPITFGATMQYQDATGTPTTLKLRDYVMYYNKGVALNVSANLTSVNSQNKLPGDTINYEIIGRNNSYYTDTSSGNWANPIITIKVPKQLRLKATTKKDFIDENNQVTYPASVTVETLPIKDTAYNYYRFKTSSTAYKSKVARESSIFRIPLEFIVDSSTASGSYQIPYVAYSSSKATDFFRGVPAQLDAAEAKKIGLDNANENSYVMNASTASSIGFSVVDASKLDSATNARGSATQSWSSSNIFAVESKGTPQMQTVIKNSGNTSFTSVRLYNLLPSASDGRGSTGSIGFTNLTNNSGTAKIYYTTKPVSQLPGYTNNDLQAWNNTKLTSLGFTTTKPANSALITAIYVDFGATTIKPGETLDAIMNFLVPDAENQKAINQFQYSAKEAKAGATLTAVSDKITFSTEFAQVAYEQNLPNVIVPGSGVKGLPSPQTIQLDVNGAGKVVIPTTKPTLSGYTFVEWQDVATATKKYQPGATISFTSTSTTTKITLKAIWKPISVNVTFNANGGSGGTAAKAYTFGTVVNLSTVAKPTRTGYTFQGWATTANAATPNITTNPLVNYTSARTYYAVWKGNSYTVKFDANGGTGTMPSMSFVYGIGKPLPANTFTKESNTFLGWARTRVSEVVYTDKQIVSILTATNNGTVTLYAKWSGQRPVLMGTPSVFDFGKQAISPMTKNYGLNSANYVGSPELQQAGFKLRLEDNRPISTGWKLNVSLSEFKDNTGKSLPQGEGITLNFANTQLQKVQYANTAVESVTNSFTKDRH